MLMLLTAAAIACASCAGHSTRSMKEQRTIDSVTLERTACYGRCPVYTIVIHGDGRVLYEGQEHVTLQGHAEGMLSRDQIAELGRAIDSADYFSLRDSYANNADGCPSTVTDQPSATTSVTIGARTKTIRHYYGCMENLSGSTHRIYPAALTTLETRIDQIVGTARWTGAEPRH